MTSTNGTIARRVNASRKIGPRPELPVDRLNGVQALEFLAADLLWERQSRWLLEQHCSNPVPLLHAGSKMPKSISFPEFVYLRQLKKDGFVLAYLKEWKEQQESKQRLRRLFEETNGQFDDCNDNGQAAVIILLDGLRSWIHPNGIKDIPPVFDRILDAFLDARMSLKPPMFTVARKQGRQRRSTARAKFDGEFVALLQVLAEEIGENGEPNNIAAYQGRVPAAKELIALAARFAEHNNWKWSKNEPKTLHNRLMTEWKEVNVSKERRSKNRNPLVINRLRKSSGFPSTELGVLGRERFRIWSVIKLADWARADDTDLKEWCILQARRYWNSNDFAKPNTD